MVLDNIQLSSLITNFDAGFPPCQIKGQDLDKISPKVGIYRMVFGKF
jgi:hypothetical protein